MYSVATKKHCGIVFKLKGFDFKVTFQFSAHSELDKLRSPATFTTIANISKVMIELTDLLDLMILDCLVIFDCN